MNTSRRFFADHPIQTSTVTLSGGEATHLVRVLRARPKDRVTLFDGSGSEFTAEVTRIDRNRVELTVLSRHEADRERDFPLSLAVALPKGDRQRWLVEKAVELGVTDFIPLITSRQVAQPTEAALRRLRKTVIEASKQCGRNRLMRVQSPQAVPQLLADTLNEPLRWIAHPAADRALQPHDAKGPVHLAVGPEGGFTQQELQAALAAGWQTVGLGPRILRVETAAVVLVARTTRE